MVEINQKNVDCLSSELGRKLKKLRSEKGLTQKELAAAIQDGVDYTYIGKIERGQQLPSLKVLQRISETLSVPIDFFLRDESETIVYVNCGVDMGDFLRNEKGRELIKALKQLNPHDIPLIVEIIRILARHRDIEMEEELGDSLLPPGDLIIATKKGSVLRKSKY
jgi:transcriptional regulator with XRE-family HTH domain